MHSLFVNGLKTLTISLVLCLGFSTLARAQDTDLSERLELELRQLRAEVDFLRNQLETGGGVADVRFADLQKRIDKVLADASALATQASTAQRRAEAAVRRVDLLEGRVSVLETGIDVLATRLARLEEDAVFAEPPATEVTVPSVEEAQTQVLETETGLQDRSIVDDDGVAVPFPKDRSEIAAPARELTQAVTVGDAEAEIVPVPRDTSPELIPVEGASPFTGALPFFPKQRPEAPVRRIPLSSPAAPSAAAVAEPAIAPVSEPALPVIQTAQASAPADAFSQAKFQFIGGDYAKASAGLQALIDGNALGANEAEGLFLVGQAYLAQQQNAPAIQALVTGLRSFPASPFAAPSLVALADALAANGQSSESCRLLSFVAVEYPNAAEPIAQASQRLVDYGC